MLPPGWPPSVPSVGLIQRASYAGPPAARMAAVSFATVAVESTVPSLLAPLSSWISSSARMSGLCRLVTTCPARRSNFACGLSGARFSTLNVATARSLWPWGAVTSRLRPPGARTGTLVSSSL